VLELAGFAAFSIAGLIGLLLITARLQGITQLGPWGVFAVYSSLILSVGGVSLFSLGMAFNHLVALFHRRPIKQHNLMATVLGASPERHFPWFGMALAALGGVLGLASLVLGLNGWELTRLWLWMLGSAMFVLVGVQLTLFGIFIRVVDALDKREERIDEDLMIGARSASPLPVSRAAAMTGPRIH
jgi:hypothetical protein